MMMGEDFAEVGTLLYAEGRQVRIAEGLGLYGEVVVALGMADEVDCWCHGCFFFLCGDIWFVDFYGNEVAGFVNGWRGRVVYIYVCANLSSRGLEKPGGRRAE